MSKPQDEYEARYVRSGDPLLHRERSVQKYHWISLGLGLLGLAMTAVPLIAWIAGIGPLFAVLLMALFPLIMLTLWVTLSVLRVHVTATELTIKLGPFGPRIPLEAIERCEVIPRPRGKYRGGAVRREADGSSTQDYMMTDAHPDMVMVTFRRGDSRVRVNLTSEDPAKLVRAVRAAQAARLAPSALASAEALPVEALPVEAEREEAERKEAERKEAELASAAEASAPLDVASDVLPPVR